MALVCCLNGFSFKNNERAFYFKVSVFYEIPVNESPITFPVVGIVWLFHHRGLVHCLLTSFIQSRKAKCLAMKKDGSSLIVFVDATLLVLIYFCFKYEKVISLRNHRKGGNRELRLCSSTQHVFLSQLSAKSEMFVGFSGSPESSVKRKMYFSSELGFVACVCCGKSAVAKF